MTITIVKAEYVKDHIIKLTFSDGTERAVNFKDFLVNARNPVIRKYLDKKLFKQFTVKYGDLEWNDYELCFPVWDLHEGTI